MSEPIVVTGIGIISAAGWGANTTERSLIEQRGGLGPLQLFDSPRNGKLPVAEVPRLPTTEGVSRTVAMGQVALTEALADAGLIESPLDLERIGFSLGCTVGGMPESEVAMAESLAGAEPDPAVWSRHELAHTAVALAESAGLRGPRLTVSTACASGAQAIANGAELLRAGLADAVLAGGVDALCRLTLNGFASLLLIDPRGCRPFDVERGGMCLGEGAAFVVLERAAGARARGARALATLAGWANTCDAHHATAPDPEGRGAEAAMRGALAAAGVSPADLAYVNAHGTGTPGNDRAEGRALARILDPRAQTEISSTKRIFGHTLGAAGAVEAVVTVLAVDRSFVPGNRSCPEPDPECAVRPLKRSKPAQVGAALSNSFGFGGNNTVLCFTRPGVGEDPPAEGPPLPPLSVLAYAVAGAADGLPLPSERRCALPPAGLHKRRARLATLAASLAKACGEVPEDTAVLLGTALGSLTETEAFVENMIREEEATPMPRAFSASVHNAISSRAAIALGARDENQTFVHGGLSFLQALFAASRRAARGASGPSLVGALDEATAGVRRAHAALGCAEPGEGGAVLRCGGEGQALASVRLVGFGHSPDWLLGAAERAAADAVLVPSGDLLAGGVVYAPFTGNHPSAVATATALAIAVVSGELPPDALGLTGSARSLAVVAATRFGELGLLLVDASP